MSTSLADAMAALAGGRRDEAVAGLIAVLSQSPDQPEDAYLTLARQLFLSGRLPEAADWTAKALERHSASADLWNVKGVVMRRLGRPADALHSLETALRLRPDLASALVNRANVLLDLGRIDAAVAAFDGLVAAEPANPGHLAALGGALIRQGRPDEAAARLRQAVALRPDMVDAWLGLGAALVRAQRPQEAEAAFDAGLAANPSAMALLRGKAGLLAETAAPERTEAFLTDLAVRHPGEAWVQFHLGDLLWEADPARGEAYLRKALALEPANLDYMLGLAQALDRTLLGDEGERLDEAYRLAARALDLGASRPEHTKIIANVIDRVCAFADVERLGDFATRGRAWVDAGLHTALFRQLARVRSREDRLELVHQHRTWGEAAVQRALRAPVVRTDGPAGAKIRVGFMSSDLRNHPVSFFIGPLLEHADRDRFELYAYSFSRQREGEVQKRLAGMVDAFRWKPFISARDAAQMIADDRLDILIELGGSTSMNKLEVMAYRPAPVQVSWLGYPHSTGVPTIDYFLCDPYTAPTAPDLLAERPLVLPHSWIALGGFFDKPDPVEPEIAEDRLGWVTFGTANHPQKYSPECLAAWARIVRAVPGSRFMFVRPEAASAIFRANVLAAFAAEGVGEERIDFEAVRGRHMPLYNDIDITLDTFPLTGGTTTIEALWMGAPVVSLVGEAFYERMSWSILSNLGLADLCAFDLAGYEQVAVALANDPERRRALHAGLRDRMRASPLGQGQAFARDFYALIAQAAGRA